MAYSLQEIGEAKNIHYVFADRTPDPKGIDRAMYALELYYEFCRTSSDGNPEVNSRWENEGWYNSAWYNLGIEDLVAASRVLQDFHFFPEAQKPVTEKLAELRALARSVAELISKSPSVHDSYFVGDRIATHDKLHVTIADAPNIIACKVAWGGFWQEKPEDAVALYREQMSSPVFCYIHSGFWFRELQSPRLVAWNKSDQRRIPVVWDNFIRALNDSTNILLRAEAKAVRLVDARNDKELTVSFNDFFDTIFANRGAFVTNNVELLYLNWGIDGLISKMGGEDVVSHVKEALQNRFYSEYRPKLDAMDREYWDKTIPARKMLAAFEAQKQYLKENKPYDFIEFIHIFENRNYSKAQALEIQPLLAAYKSNLVAQADGQSGVSKYKTLDGVHQVGFFLENGVNRILNPPAPQPANAVVQNRSPVVAAKPKAVPAIPKVLAENATNILLVKNYLKVPRDRFTATNINNFGISANRWSNGKLLLDLRYRGDIYSGDYKVASGALFVAAAIFDPSNGSWIIMEYPGDYFRDPTLGLINQNKSGLCFELFQDDFYSSAGGPLNKFDSKTRKWEILNIPGQNNSQLFGIDEVFYAANGENIIEIINGGKGTHILASTRRRPAVSTLDSLGGLGSPILFSGLNHSLCASVGNKIYNWDGNDWRELFALNILRRPEIFEEAVVFRSAPTFNSDDRANLWLWKKDQAQPELSLSDNPKPHPGIVNNSIHKPDSLPSRALWKSPMGDYLVSSAAVYFKSNLYFFVDHANIVNQSGQWTVTEKDGCHARLVCLSRDLPEPVVVPLKFNLQQGRPPLKSLGEKFEQVPWLAGDTWMQFAGDALYIGQPDTPGIWLVPISEIEAAVSAQKQFLLDKIEQATATAKQVKEELLAKYDHNHNGVIDSEEKEEVLDDPVFIESELAAIDANHNGCLDAVELVYFDANGNKILDAKEQAGIEVAEDLLAAKFMKEFDADGNGVFNRSEFDAVWRSGLEADFTFAAGFSWPDPNHDGQVDLGEFESFLKGQTLRGLYPRGMPGAAFVGQMRPGDSKRIGPQERFKISVEAYWQNPGSINNRPPLTGNAITNGTQSGKIQ
jgi:Ca2+-binding EF-hand superfamily protein